MRWRRRLSPKTLRNETKKLQLSLTILWTELMSTLSFCGRNKPVCRAVLEFPCLFVLSAVSINLRPSSRDTSVFCPGNTHPHPHTSCLTSWRTASASWKKSLHAACTGFNAFTLNSCLQPLAPKKPLRKTALFSFVFPRQRLRLNEVKQSHNC